MCLLAHCCLFYSLSPTSGTSHEYSFTVIRWNVLWVEDVANPKPPDAPCRPHLWWSVFSMYSWCVNHVSVIIQYKVSFGLSVQVQCVGEGFQLAAIVEQCVVTSGKEVPRGWHSCSHHAGILQFAFPPFMSLRIFDVEE